MRAYRIASYTGPAGLELVHEPDPAAPVGRQVIVRLHASSINFRELLDLRGFMAAMVPMPDRRIPGSDGAGEVVAIGPDVTRVKIGDRVATTFHAGWIGGTSPHDLNVMGRGAKANDGTLVEFTRVDESELVLVPDHLSFEEAATLPCAGVTAWYSLFGVGPLLPGSFVLLQGTGGVSTFAMQFARTAGLRVIATTTSPSKAQRLLDQGVEKVIDASAGVEWASGVLAATGGLGVDLAVNIAGGNTIEACVQATRRFGRIVLVGAREAPLSALSAAFMFRGISIHVTRVGSRDHFEQMNRSIAATKLKPVLDRIFEFEDAPRAFEYFATARHIGKVVIRHSVIRETFRPRPGADHGGEDEQPGQAIHT